MFDDDEPRAAVAFSPEKGRAAAAAILTLTGAKPLHDVFRNGMWRLCERNGWPDNQSCLNILTRCRIKDTERRLIVISFGDAAAQARVQVSKVS